MEQNTPGVVAANAINAASNNIESALSRLPENPSVKDLLAAASAQTEMAKACALLEIGRQLSALSAIATPGASIRYGLAEVAEALRENGPTR